MRVITQSRASEHETRHKWNDRRSTSDALGRRNKPQKHHHAPREEYALCLLQCQREQPGGCRCDSVDGRGGTTLNGGSVRAETRLECRPNAVKSSLPCTAHRAVDRWQPRGRHAGRRQSCGSECAHEHERTRIKCIWTLFVGKVERVRHRVHAVTGQFNTLCNAAAAVLCLATPVKTSASRANACAAVR